jgi:hypothetical protein
MAIALYSSLRPQLDSADWAIAATSGGNLTGSGTLTFYLQSRSRSGRNLLGAGKTIAYSAGQKIVVTIDASARKSGEDVFAFVLSASSGVATNAKQLAEWRAKSLDRRSDRSLSGTIELTRDEHLVLGGTSANIASLPTNRIHGMVRQVGADYLKWDSEATAGVQQAGTGYWVTWESPNTYLASTDSIGGCDRSVSDGNPNIIRPLPYAADGSDSEPVRYWLVNGLDEDGGGDLAIGSLIDLSVAVNGEPTTIFDSLISIRVLGYARRSTGILTTVPESNASYLYTAGNFLFALSQVLPRGYALAVEVIFAFDESALADNGRPLIPPDAVITAYPYLKGRSGTFSPFGDFFGDCVSSEGGKLRVLPAAAGYKRAGGVAQVANYFTPKLGEELFSLGLQADSTGQKVCISGVRGGDCVIRDNPLANEAIRAIVSTAAGEATASALTSPVTLSSGQILSVSIAFPSAIRADYPDVIAGAAATFNAPAIRLYIQVGSTIYRKNQPISVSGSSLNLTISDTLDTTIVGSLPTNADAGFNLWGYGAISSSASSGAGTLPTGQPIRIAVAYWYPSPNLRLTKISHDPLAGCLPELGLTFTEAIDLFKYWQPPALTKSALKNLASADRSEGEARLCLQNNRIYRFTPNLSQADDGETYLASIDNAGRGWISIAGVGTGGGTVAASTAINAFTATTANFSVPAVNSTVSVSVADSSWMAIGQPVFVEGSGLYRVTTIASSISITLTNVSGTGTSVNAGAKISPSGERGPQGNTGSPGATGATGPAGPIGATGAAAYTTTTADFTVPASGATVSIALGSTAWAIANMPIFVQGAGHYRVSSITNSTALVATNLGYSGNAAAGGSISSGARVSPGGEKGADGAAGGGGSGGSSGRTLLTSDRVYYVRATGSDSNDGLTTGTAFATPQKALDELSKLDGGGLYSGTVDIGAGSFPPIVLRPCVGFSEVLIAGAGTGSTTIQDTSESYMAIVYCIGGITPYRIQNLTIKKNQNNSSTVGFALLQADSYSQLTIENCNLTMANSNGGYVVYSTNNAKIDLNRGLSGSYNNTFSGNAWAAISAERKGLINTRNTITFSGSPNYSFSTVFARGLSYIDAAYTSFTGSVANATRVNLGGLSFARDSGANGSVSIPGSSNTLEFGSQYQNNA